MNKTLTITELHALLQKEIEAGHGWAVVHLCIDGLEYQPITEAIPEFNKDGGVFLVKVDEKEFSKELFSY